MPVSPTYPGVYIEEVPSAVRTISGVATSITAFVGRALRGPTDKPLRISSWGDFERKYGGLWQESMLGYSVSQYFLNGGIDAVIARVHNDGIKASVDTSPATGDWELLVSAFGAAGNNLRLSVTHNDDGTINIRVDSTSDGGISWTEVDPGNAALQNIDTSTLTAGQAIGATGLVLGATIPSRRPAVVTNQRLGGGIDAADATVSIPGAPSGTLTFVSAFSGEVGNHLVAIVSPATDGTSDYDLEVRLLAGDGTVVEQGIWINLTAGSGTLGAATGTQFIDATTAVPTTVPVVDAGIERAFAGGVDGAQASILVSAEGTDIAYEAASEGTWGNRLQVRVDHSTKDAADPSPALVNLTVQEVDDSGRVVAQEVHRNVSVSPSHARFIRTILDQESDLIRIQGPDSGLPSGRPVAGGFNALEGGSDGAALDAASYIDPALEGAKQGLWLLERTDLFNLLVVPPMTRTDDVPAAVWTTAMAYCKARRAMLVVDAPASWDSKDDVTGGLDGFGMQGDNATNATMLFPRVKIADPLAEYRLADFAPSGAYAGVVARTDVQRGIWKAPAGTDATLTGVRGLASSLTDNEHGQINPLGVNVIRAFPVIGHVVWGARTIRGADALASEWKYVPVRRLALYIEESLYRGTQWAVFEGNDAPLWSQLRLNIGAFMHNLFRQGAFQGSSPRDAYLVKCDGETTTQNDIDRGVVNVVVGFRPLKPAEFVILKISQLAGQAGA
jgi:uncharacterized protein